MNKYTSSVAILFLLINTNYFSYIYSNETKLAMFALLKRGKDILNT